MIRRGYTAGMGDAIRFKTANLWWVIRFDRQNHHTTATVDGQPTPVARPGPIEPKRDEHFSFTDSNQDTLMQRIRDEIERRDGPITSTGPDDDY